MVRGKRRHLNAATIEQRAETYHQRLGALFGQAREGGIDLRNGPGSESFDLPADGPRRCLRFLDHGLGILRRRIDQDGKARRSRNKLIQEAETLGCKLAAQGWRSRWHCRPAG
jgi:hypothetical protein